MKICKNCLHPKKEHADSRTKEVSCCMARVKYYTAGLSEASIQKDGQLCACNQYVPKKGK